MCFNANDDGKVVSLCEVVTEKNHEHFLLLEGGDIFDSVYSSVNAGVPIQVIISG